MNRRAIGLAMTAWLATTGCDRLPFIGGGDETPADSAAQVAMDTTAPAAAMPESTAAPAPPAGPQQTQPAARPAAQRTAAQPVAQMDEPWTPTQTGTVNPGMTRDEVIAVWGEPVAESATAARTYLYYRNGCEVTCGTFDVVFLEDNQVVDAIVRAPGHTYSGVSSSPPGREALPTLPGTTGGTAD